MSERTSRPLSAGELDQEDRLVPTSVWPTGTLSFRTQLEEGGYHEATGTDSALMAPAIARYAISAFTKPADVVLDPDCGAGTTVVEALRCGRHAIGLTDQRRWWRLARANVTTTKADGVFVDGMVLVLDRRHGTAVAAATAGLTGRVDLLLTALRPGRNSDMEGDVDRLGTLLAQYRPLVRPGGHIVVTCSPHRHPTRHELLDVPGRIEAIGNTAGLVPVARCVALTAAVQRGRTHTRTTFAQRRAVRRAEDAFGYPIALPAHHTVLVFHADPDAIDQAAAEPAWPSPTRVDVHRRRRRSRRRPEAATSGIDTRTNADQEAA
ncbi:DNA methylase [Amycolatopsis japonica]|uniref:DNA methylase n=1 Tax=Amycolatopsis japonica TaxID=208439 RepID=A0A075UNF0_9PSEU|nr:DNA methyltransferase [Amycolatopsis japonica]AIG74413.1 DNA methylase [Amycolatopsis japonica]